MVSFPAGIIFMRAPPRKMRLYITCACAPLSGKKCNFAKYKSPEYFDSEQSGLYLDNCAFRDGTL